MTRRQSGLLWSGLTFFFVCQASARAWAACGSSPPRVGYVLGNLNENGDAVPVVVALELPDLNLFREGWVELVTSVAAIVVDLRVRFVSNS